jgi:HAD superfamily hydrolase (TIGR01509 family)
LKKLEILTKEFGLPIELYDFINYLKQSRTHKLIELNAQPNYSHEYCLKKLKDDEFKIGLCSNSMRKTVLDAMEKVCLIKYFDIILTNEDVINPKPNPEIYLKAIKQLNVSPQEVLILEDNPNGILAAKLSGANVMLINNVEDVNYQNIKNQIESYS